jgi:MFS family permease
VLDVHDDASTDARVWRRGVGFFITSRMLSIIGDMAALTALSVYIYTAFDSATMVSGLFVVRVLPRLFGPLAGAVADRYNLRTLMVVCDLGAGLLFAVIAVVQPSYWALLALILVAESIATIAMPGARTWVARRVPPDARGRLNGVLTAGIAIGFGVGAGIGGVTASEFGYRWALLVNALSFVVSAALVTAAGSVPPAEAAGAQRPRLVSSAVAGTRLIFSESRLSGVAVGLIGVAFAAAVDRPAVVALTQDDLPGGGGGYGLLLGMISIGALAVSLGVGRLKALSATTGVFIAGLLVQVVGHLGLGLSPWLAIAAVMALIMGVGNGLESVVGSTLLQEAAPAEHVGTVVAAVVSASFIADGVGSLIGGRLVDALGPRLVFAIAALLMAGCATYVTAVTRAAVTQPAATGPAVTGTGTDTSVASGGGASGNGEDR